MANGVAATQGRGPVARRSRGAAPAELRIGRDADRHRVQPEGRSSPIHRGLQSGRLAVGDRAPGRSVAPFRRHRASGGAARRRTGASVASAQGLRRRRSPRQPRRRGRRQLAGRDRARVPASPIPPPARPARPRHRSGGRSVVAWGRSMRHPGSGVARRGPVACPSMLDMGRGFSAVRHRNFRLYWIGQIVSLVGTWMQSVSQPWLVLLLGGSHIQLGDRGGPPVRAVPRAGAARAACSPTGSTSGAC